MITGHETPPSPLALLVLWLEWLFLFIIAPLIVWAELVSGHKLLLFILPILYALVVYRRIAPHAPRVTPVVSEKKELVILLVRAAVIATLLGIGIRVFAPEIFLAFPRNRPRIWLIVMCAYPFVSALPQEFLYRRFYFARYTPLFPSSAMMALTSILTFAYLHIMYDNIYSILLTAVGGWLFTRTYRRTGSLRLAALEHAVYGMMMFTLGLGRLFYEGPR